MGIEGSQFCTNPLLPSPCRCSMWVTSPLEQPLRNSRLSFTQAHQTCECPPSFTPVQSVVSTDTSYPDHPSLALLPWFPHLRPDDTCLLCPQLHMLCSDISSLPPSGLPKRPSALPMVLEGFLAYDTVRVTCKQKLSQDSLRSDHGLQNRCRTIWQDPS